MGEAEVHSLPLTCWTNIVSPNRAGDSQRARHSSSRFCPLHASSDVSTLETSSVLKMHVERFLKRKPSFFYLKTKCTNLQTSDKYCLCKLYLKPGMFPARRSCPIVFVSRVIIDAIKKVLWSKCIIVVIFKLRSFCVSVFVVFWKQFGLIPCFSTLMSSPRYSVVSGSLRLRS